MKALRALVPLLAILALPAGAAPQVGSVSFPNSGSEDAQAPFLRGLALLHNFEYGTAAAAFREAQEIDPGFAMAYWGEAMTYNHPVWLEQDSTAARQTLERLGADPAARAATAGTERERGYLGAIEVLYGSGTKEERDFAYRDEMKRVHERWPDDPEAAAFYALSILGTAHSGRDYAIYMQAAAVVEEVFDRYPDHPGAAHYLIHSYDDPLHAPLGLRAALAYSGIAPDAAHAQHMTSHIFVAMGMWDAVVAANENARQVVRSAVEARGGTPRGCGHYNFWLEYGYLQQGRHEEAKALLRECFDTAGGSGSVRRSGDILDPDNSSRGSYAGMLARYILDTEEWDDESLRWTLPLDDLFPARMTWTFINGYAAAKRGELVTTEVSREALAETRTELDAYLAGTPSGGDASLGEAFRTRARILEMELEALIEAARGNEDRAVAIADEAAGLEAGMPVFFGPPMVDKPARELLGELLLEFGHATKAIEAFEAQLERTPERLASVRGLERAKALAASRLDPDAEREAVLAVVQAFFDAMGSADAEAGAAVVTENAVFVGTTTTPDGVRLNEMDRDGFLALLGEPGMLERMWDPTVMIHGTVAVVWTPYDFHVDGEFSHCGVDAFNLVRTNEGWRIASIVWTVEPTGCEPSPLGPPEPSS